MFRPKALVWIFVTLLVGCPGGQVSTGDGDAPVAATARTEEGADVIRTTGDAPEPPADVTPPGDDVPRAGDTMRRGRGADGAEPPTDAGSCDDGCGVCQPQVLAARTRPLTLIVVLDRSLSMAGENWSASISALSAFFNAPSSEGVVAGVNFFPPIGSGDPCAAQSYDPLQVPLGELASAGPTLVSAIETVEPDGGTPTHGAVLGSLQFAAAHKAARPERTVALILASDGEPTVCSTSVDAIAALAESARVSDGIRTFAVALPGAPVAFLGSVAAAGGTGPAFDITADPTRLGQVMAEIQAQAAGCEYLFDADPELLSHGVVVRRASAGSLTALIPPRDGEGSCGQNAGWYVRDPAPSSPVVLCPATCAAVTGDPTASVELLVGCPPGDFGPR